MNMSQYNPTPLNDRIEQVIKKRQSLALKVQPVHAHLVDLLQKVLNLGQHYQRFKNSPAALDARDTLGQIDLMQLAFQIQAERDRLDNLISRLSRPTLNIGVVGRMRQGKSTFLQQLSGLDNAEIPAYQGGACTAVRSKIYHHEGETEVSVTFHSESSFMQEVIEPYYAAFDINSPADLDAFASLPLPMRPTDSTVKEAMHEHLEKDYYQNLPQYRGLLKGNTINIPKEEIPVYVVQKRDAHRRLTTFSHLAVREVEIRCRFKHSGVSKLGLIDVPGMGDTRLGDGQLILETLGRQVDAVLFLRRPDGKGYQWEKEDLALYDLADKALPNLAARSFMVMNNQSDGYNLQACQSMQLDLGTMKVVECRIADCTSAQEASAVLDRVLQYLDQEILNLEEQYVKTCQASLLTLQATLDQELSQINSMSSAATQKHHLFRRLFKQFMQDLSTGLRDLVEELEQEKGQDDEDFQRAVKKVLDEYERNTGIPETAEIKTRRIGPICHGSYKAAYCMYVAELRAKLSKHFSALDAGFQQATNKLKVRVAQTLLDQVKLKGLTPLKGSDFLEVMTSLLAAQNNPLQVGFQQMVNFNVACGDLICDEIQKDLGEILDPDELVLRRELAERVAHAVQAMGAVSATVGGLPLNLNPDLVKQAVGAVDQLATAATSSFFKLDDEAIHEQLKVLNQQAMRQCEQTLQRWLSKPSSLRYAKATEFVDLVLDDKEIQDAWESFLVEPSICNKVWPEFAELERLQALQAAWLNAVQAVQNANQRQKMEFLK